MKEEKARELNILTIPNALTFLRLLLIPVILWMYLVREDVAGTLVCVAVSALSDVLDGFIARRFNMVSRFGTAFDPVVDKLTQGAMLVSLLKKFPGMLWLLILLAVKEVTTGIMSLIVLRRSSRMRSAEWPGKLTTGLLYATAMTHILWPELPRILSLVLMVICVVMMLVAFVYYGRRNLTDIREFSSSEEKRA